MASEFRTRFCRLLTVARGLVQPALISALEFSESEIGFQMNHLSEIAFPVSQDKTPLSRQLEKNGKEKPSVMAWAFLPAKISSPQMKLCGVLPKRG